MEDQIRKTNNWIYKTKKIQLWSPFGARGAADRGIESLRFQVSRRRPEVKRSEEETTHKNYLDEDKKSAINKKINSQIKKPHLKMIPIKDNQHYCVILI